MAQPNSRSATLSAAVFDQARAEAAVRELLYAIGEDPEDLADRARRAASYLRWGKEDGD